MENRTQIKCLFVGLDNGGKTSLLLALEKKFLKILMTKPTKQIAISNLQVLGIPMKIWDMGGRRSIERNVSRNSIILMEQKYCFIY